MRSRAPLAFIIMKRNTENDKKTIKKAFKIVLIVFLSLLVLLAAGYFITEYLRDNPDDEVSEREKFFEPDYSFNILEDELYLSLDRNVMFTRNGVTQMLESNDPSEVCPAAAMFYDYFNCLINGDYANYKTFFTDEYIKDNSDDIPEKFTMQAVYDINCKCFSSSVSDNTLTEIYEVSYRIFENNGTFRRDVVSTETRTLVFELKINGDTAKINSIAFRKTKRYSE